MMSVIKRMMTLFLCVLMMVGACIPCCSEPWLENPDDPLTIIDIYDIDYHVWVTRTAYYCTHCGEYYIEEDYSENEPHNFEPYGTGRRCVDCGFVTYEQVG